jgi:flavorubredoxin
METRIDEIAGNIFRLSTFVPDANIMFNQFIVRADEPLLWHTGPRALFPLVSDAVGRVVPLDQLRWITFGHVEADECGAMNPFLAAAPNAKVAHGAIACMVQVNDLADRAPQPLGDGDVTDLGGKRVRNIDTPHIPHGWDAHVLFEETTGTLFCGDLFTRFGESEPNTNEDLVEAALDGEQFGAPTALTPSTAPTIRRLSELGVTTLALMHGPSYSGDCAKQLLGLADGYDAMLREAEARV